MALQFHRVAVVGKYQDPASGPMADSTREIIADIAEFLSAQGCEVVLTERTAASYEVFFTLAALYLVLTGIVAMLFRLLERRLAFVH